MKEDNEVRMEEDVVGDETIDIPSDLYTGPAASSFISHTIKINKTIKDGGISPLTI